MSEWLAAFGGGSSVVASLVGILVSLGIGGVVGTQLSDALNRRREAFAEGVAALVAWAEYPFVIRRRTADDPATLHDLADRGHAMQERIARSAAWMANSSRRRGQRYRALSAEIKRLVAPLIIEAWNSPPITTPSEMVLEGWGVDVSKLVTKKIEAYIKKG